MTNTTINNATDTNTTSPGSGSDNNRDSNIAWVIPIAVLVPLVFLCVVCIIWGRWVYKRGKKRYWQRVQNEHLMAYGATEDTGQTYGIGELYENKYFASDHLEEINKNINDRTIKGNEDEQRKSLPRQNSANGKNWYEQTENHLTAVPPGTSSNNSQKEDSGILSTSDNISDSTVVDKIDEENIDVTLQERNSDEEDSKQRKDAKETEHKNEHKNEQNKDKASEDEHGFEITVTFKSSSQTTQDLTTDKILTTDV